MEIFELIRQVNTSKKIPRTGWVREGIQNPETVAEHSFGTIFLAMLLGPKLQVDEEKLVKMAIIHDIAETKTGDQVVERGQEELEDLKEQKQTAELEAIKDFFGDSDYQRLFKEMIDQRSHEAQIFRQLDKLEMAFQALSYEEETGKSLSEFYENAEKNIHDPYLKEILTSILSRRPQ